MALVAFVGPYGVGEATTSLNLYIGEGEKLPQSSPTAGFPFMLRKGLA